MDIYNIFDKLNNKQQEAVISNDTNILVLAGAGSGKTRVLVNRIIWLQLVKKYAQNSIMAITFTNKAALLIRNRLQSFISIQQNNGMWINTFHGIAHRLLRIHYADTNLPKNFQILDTNDQIRLVTQLIRSLNLNENKYNAHQVLRYINLRKDKILDTHDVHMNCNSVELMWFNIYKTYQKMCNKFGLVDFNELLKRAYMLCLNCPHILNYYKKRFINILVDEFQDTNQIQYAWLRLFSGENNNFLIVGDDDQSIYGWRGAKVENFQLFLKDFRNVRIIKLEQNYRSTFNILKAANALIYNNNARLQKRLWTRAHSGDLISLYCAISEVDEVLFVVNNLINWKRKRGLFNTCAVLYRNNFQSRLLEEIFLKKHIPYQVYGGVRFFERKEIKDIMAYLKFIVNQYNDVAYIRIINTPSRGIGRHTLEIIANYANLNHLSMWESSLFISDKNIIKGKPAIALKEFITLINSCKKKMLIMLPVYKQIYYVIRQSGLWDMYSKKKSMPEYCEHIQNIEELITMSKQYSISAEKTMNMYSLEQFLSYVSLEFEENLPSLRSDAVQLMTVHSAKGLEFSQVFIVGLEEGIFPHYIALTNQELLEEERRLMYVGITRAMHKLTISYSETRYFYGKNMVMQSPSRFVNELPQDCLEIC